MATRNRPWDRAADRELKRRKRLKEPHAAIAEAMGRTVKSINNRVIKLKLAKRKQPSWLGPERAVLRKQWGSVTMRQLRSNLRKVRGGRLRTPGAVRREALRLGLAQPNYQGLVDATTAARILEVPRSQLPALLAFFKVKVVRRQGYGSRGWLIDEGEVRIAATGWWDDREGPDDVRKRLGVSLSRIRKRLIARGAKRFLDPPEGFAHCKRVRMRYPPKFYDRLLPEWSRDGISLADAVALLRVSRYALRADPVVARAKVGGRFVLPYAEWEAAAARIAAKRSSVP